MKADEEYVDNLCLEDIKYDSQYSIDMLKDDIELYIEQCRLHAIRFAYRHKEFTLEEIIELYRKQINTPKNVPKMYNIPYT